MNVELFCNANNGTAGVPGQATRTVTLALPPGDTPPEPGTPRVTLIFNQATDETVAFFKAGKRYTVAITELA